MVRYMAEETLVEIAAVRKGIEAEPWEIKIEKKDGLIKIKVPEGRIEKIDGNVIFVIPEEKFKTISGEKIEIATEEKGEVKKSQLRECGESVASAFWFLLKAREAREKGDRDKVETLLSAAASFANQAAKACEIPEFKKLGDVLSKEEIEKFEEEVDKFMEEDLLGVGEAIREVKKEIEES